MEITVKTDRKWRNFLYGYELSKRKRKDFYYLDWGKDGDAMTHDFFRYRGRVYDPGEFMPAPQDVFPGWDGIHNDTFFSGILIKFSPDGEQYQAATFIS